MHVTDMPEENVLSAGPVVAKLAAKHGRQSATGAQVTLKTRLPGVTLAAFRTDKHGLAGLIQRQRIVQLQVRLSAP